jgi:hypothetical protein
MGLQILENKVLSCGIIGKSAPILAEITLRKSQEHSGASPLLRLKEMVARYSDRA